jgi:hypothetical protein
MNESATEVPRRERIAMFVMTRFRIAHEVYTSCDEMCP